MKSWRDEKDEPSARVTSRRSVPWWVAGGVMLAASLTAQPAVGWQFDRDPDTSCAVHKERNFNLKQSQLYFMLDESGSMGGWKWREATDAIETTVDQMTYDSKEDVVQFGLGWFSGWADTKVSPKEDADGEIKQALNHSPGGGTRMDRGLKNARETLLAEPDASSRPQATLLITDGFPNSGSEQNTLDEACAHRAVGPAYTVGFGSGTYEEFNDLIAAAGNTGWCCKDGGTCTETSTANHVDPCASDQDPLSSGNVRSNWECHGSIQVSGGSGLQTAATEIANDLACRIDVTDGIWDEEYSKSGYGCASSDYSCLKLDWGGSTGLLDYRPNDPSGTGWRWVDASKQDTIELNTSTCNDIEKEGTSNKVTLQRACMCGGKTVGAECDRAGVPKCECMEGHVACTQSQSFCDPKSECQNRNENALGQCTDSKSNTYGTCEKRGNNTCDGGSLVCGVAAPTPAPEADVCDGIDSDCDGEVDEGVLTGDTCTIPGKTGRCAVGYELCNGGCKEVHRPVPEICNGIDDDCNGTKDDIRTSWENESQITLSNLSSVNRDRACGKVGACSCDPGEEDPKVRGDESDGTRQQEFDAMVRETETQCRCGE